jgi:flagellar hook capping protein FlgD
VLASVALCFLASGVASAAWPEFGRAICTAPSGQMHATLATDGAGGAIITWQDLRNPKVNIFAQHVLASGQVDAGWPQDGRALLNDPLAMANADGGQFSPLIVSDRVGGAVVAWQDNRSSVTETDIFAQHVLASGVVDGGWPANGAVLCAALGVQNTTAMTSDGAGGAIVTWVDSRAGAGVFDIYAQHVLPSGIVDARWPANGIPVCTASGAQGFPAIVSDEAGGAIITWHDQRDGSTGFDIYAQRILSPGAVAPGWPVDGRAVCTASGDQGRPTLTSDGVHGAIVVWSDSRVVGTSHIFAQHVFGSGTVDAAWPVNGRAVSDAALLESRPLAVSDGAGGALVTWQGFTVHLNMYVQHVTATGVVDPTWPVGGRALSDTDRQQTHASIVPDDAGGAVIAWQDSVDIVAQHVLASGALDPAYPDTGRAVCNLPSQQGEPALVATGAGGAIVSWTDGRSGIDADIYAHQVMAAATTGVPAPGPGELAFFRASPNPGRGSLALRFTLPRETRVRLAIYDISGRQLRELASGVEPAGDLAIGWDLRDANGGAVSAGLYFARLEMEGRSFTQTLVTLK